MASGSSIGMMDPAFFLGRRAILEWLNSTFQLNLAKIEETASGAVAAQLLDAIYPGEVAMQKVRWDGKSAHEYIDNYKVVQAVFEKKGIDKYIDVGKLVRGKYQDNLENMQWFKSFFERNYAGQPYDPLSRRARGRGADLVPAFAIDPARRGPPQTDAEGARSATGSRAGADGGARAAAGSVLSARRAAAGGSLANAPAGALAPASLKFSPSGAGAAPRSAGGGGGFKHSPGGSAVSALAAQLDAAHARIGELEGIKTNMQTSIESLEKERDFYFGKLRDVEIMLQAYTGPDRPTVDALFKILYATDDADFVTLQDGGGDGAAE